MRPDLTSRFFILISSSSSCSFSGIPSPRNLGVPVKEAMAQAAFLGLENLEWDTSTSPSANKISFFILAVNRTGKCSSSRSSLLGDGLLGFLSGESDLSQKLLSRPPSSLRSEDRDGMTSDNPEGKGIVRQPDPFPMERCGVEPSL
jgi:hypothetical protein